MTTHYVLDIWYCQLNRISANGYEMKISFSFHLLHCSDNQSPSFLDEIFEYHVNISEFITTRCLAW